MHFVRFPHLSQYFATDISSCNGVLRIISQLKPVLKMYAFSLVLFVAFVCASNPVVKSGSESASFVSNTAALVTPRPQISHEDLRKRQVLVDTCGYLNGISSISHAAAFA